MPNLLNGAGLEVEIARYIAPVVFTSAVSHVECWMRQAIREGSVHLFWKRRALGGVSSRDAMIFETLKFYFVIEVARRRSSLLAALVLWNRTSSETRHCPGRTVAPTQPDRWVSAPGTPSRLPQTRVIFLKFSSNLDLRLYFYLLGCLPLHAR